MRVKITVVEAGTRNAACLGYDSRDVEVDSVEDARESTLYAMACDGCDTDRYRVEVELLDEAARG